MERGAVFFPQMELMQFKSIRWKRRERELKGDNNIFLYILLKERKKRERKSPWVYMLLVSVFLLFLVTDRGGGRFTQVAFRVDSAESPGLSLNE